MGNPRGAVAPGQGSFQAVDVILARARPEVREIVVGAELLVSTGAENLEGVGI